VFKGLTYDSSRRRNIWGSRKYRSLLSLRMWLWSSTIRRIWLNWSRHNCAEYHHPLKFLRPLRHLSDLSDWLTDWSKFKFRCCGYRVTTNRWEQCDKLDWPLLLFHGYRLWMVTIVWLTNIYEKHCNNRIIEQLKSNAIYDSLIHYGSISIIIDKQYIVTCHSIHKVILQNVERLVIILFSKL